MKFKVNFQSNLSQKNQLVNKITAKISKNAR